MEQAAVNANNVIVSSTAVKGIDRKGSTVTTASAARRAPVQERSRQTVIRILDAAAAIADEEGVDAATTRAIADRAGVSYPSLYRFFPDREAILGELLERQCAELDARCVEAERTWRIESVADLLDNELALHVHYYRQHPSTARMWMGGRTSPAVTGYVRARMRTLADRMHGILLAAGLIPADTDPRTMLVAVEMADRVLELSYRGGDFDEQILAIGRRALIAFGRDLSGDLAGDLAENSPRSPR